MKQNFDEFEDLLSEPALSQLKKDPEKDFYEAAAVKAKVIRLMENEDYKWLVAVMQSNLDGRVQNVFKVVTGVDSAITNLCSMAEIRGFQAAMLFLQSMKNGADATIESCKPYIKENE